MCGRQLRHLGPAPVAAGAGNRTDDEVIVPSFTFAATANAVAVAGATRCSWISTPTRSAWTRPQIVPAITAGPGRSCQCTCTATPRQWPRSWTSPATTSWSSWRTPPGPCRRTGRTTGRRLGTGGCVLFYPTKNTLTSGEGGMVVTDDPELARMVRLLRNQGMEKRYHHNEVAGLNNRNMTDVHAAIGRTQLRKLPGWTRRRQEIAAIYDEQLVGVTTYRRARRQHVYHQYTIRVTGDRDAFVAALADRGVGSGVYHPVPVHRLPTFAEVLDLPRPNRRPPGDLVAGAPGALRRGRRDRCRGCEQRGRGGVMADLRAGLIGLGMMGRHHARVLAVVGGVDLVAVADRRATPRGRAGLRRACRCGGVDRRRHRLLRRGGAHPPSITASPWGWPPQGYPRWWKPLAATSAGGRRHRRRLRRWPGSWLIILSSGYNPALQQAPRGSRPVVGRRVPGGDPPGRSLSGADRRCRSGEGPGHSDIDLTPGSPNSGTPVSRRRPPPPFGPAARRPGGDHRAAQRRHRDEPSGQLAVADEGTPHRDHRREGAFVADTFVSGPDVLRQRLGPHPMGSGRRVPRCQRGRRGPVLRTKPEPLRTEHGSVP